MKTAAQNGKHGRSIVLGKEMFSGYTSTSPERVSVRKEGEGHSMEMDISTARTFLSSRFAKGEEIVDYWERLNVPNGAEILKV